MNGLTGTWIKTHKWRLLLFGIGLDATLSTSMTLYLNYFADIGFNDYLAQNVVAGLKARF